MKKIYSLIIVLFFPLVSFSQIDNEVWVDYIYNNLINQKVTIYGDATFRTGSSYVIGVRPSIKYKVNNRVFVMGGLGNNLLFSPVLDTLKNIEIRPWQGVRVVWPQTSFLMLKHFFRLEEQFITNVGDGMDFNGTLRFRYQIGVQLDLWDSPDGTHDLGMPIEYEIFNTLNLDPLNIERDRFIIGLDYTLRNSFVIEFNYILQRNGEEYGSLVGHKNIYRFRLRKTFNARLKRPLPRE